MYARAARAYRTVDLESAPKIAILDRLYSRLLRDLDDAGQAISGGDVTARAAACDHAIQIVTELLAALDRSAGAAALCDNLAALYTFAIDKITAANVNRDPVPLREAAAVIGELQSAFREAGGAA